MDVIPSSLLTKERLASTVPGFPCPLINVFAFWGHLHEIPKELLTWELMTLNAEQGDRATPLRDAAKYDRLHQLPPTACAGHFQHAKAIVLGAVEASRNWRRAERRYIAVRWLLRVLLSPPVMQDAFKIAVAEIRSFSQGTAASGWDFVIQSDFPAAPPSSCSPDEALLYWIHAYVTSQDERYLDFAMTEGYLQSLLA